MNGKHEQMERPAPGLSWQNVVLTIGMAFIAAVPPSIIAWNAKSEAAAAKEQATQTHNAVNSRMTELLEITRNSARDAATLKEKAAQAVREGEAAVDAAKPTPKGK